MYGLRDFMKFVFCVENVGMGIWAGDTKVLLGLCEGMKNFGVDARIIHNLNEYKKDEYLFLTNNCHDMRPEYWFTQLYRMNYGVIPFCEDYIQYFQASTGFYLYVLNALMEKEDEVGTCSLERLFEIPNLVYYYGLLPPKKSLKNYDVLKEAEVIIASSHREVDTLKRDIPSSDPKMVNWNLGFEHQDPDDEFLRFTGMKKGEYVLQVGRLEHRKNQLGTVLATKDFDAPLVLIATKAFQPDYGKLVIEAIKKWRKAPTLIISQDLEACEFGNFKIIPMPKRGKLSLNMLSGAFANAGLYLHPAFYELPGMTYFESAVYGIPTIASSWTSCKCYLTDHKTGEYTLDDRIEYCTPYDLPSIRELVSKKFGTFYSGSLPPIFQRTKEDVAKEVLNLIQKDVPEMSTRK